MGYDTLKYFYFFAMGGNLDRLGLDFCLGPLKADIFGRVLLSFSDRDLLFLVSVDVFLMFIISY